MTEDAFPFPPKEEWEKIITALYNSFIKKQKDWQRMTWQRGFNLHFWNEMDDLRMLLEGYEIE